MKKTFFAFLFTLMILCNTQEIKVYMIVNSHLDAGWVATFEQYYTGKNTPLGRNVMAIYDNVIPKLEENSHWTYVVGEVGFFARWWQDQSDSMKERVKKLINNKQLEFVNGGWVAHDEATPTYEDMLENLAQGSVWLKNNFDIEVDIGWQLDSFGTGSTHASLLAQAGYRILFFSRLGDNERQIRRDNQELEFIWRPPNPHNNALLTHIFGAEYELTPYVNWAGMVEDIFNRGFLPEDSFRQISVYINNESKVFRSSDFLFPLVGDFYNPARDYDGMQNMVDSFNNQTDKGFSIGFSTLANFTDSLYRDLEFDTLPNKTDDFFPYISRLNRPWTGYFTSKPSFKALVRGTSHYLNALRTLFMRMTFTIKRQSSDDDLWAALTKLGQVLSILQHHDSITGTSKEFVRYDYENMVRNAMQDVETKMQNYFTRFISVEYNSTNKKQNNTQTNNIRPESNLKSNTLANYFFWDKNVPQLILDPIFWSGNTLKKSQIIQDNNIPSSFLEDDSDPIYIFAFNPGTTNETVVSLTIPKRETYNLKIEDTTGKQFSPDIFCLNIPHDTCYIRWMDQFSRLQTKIYRISQDLSFKLAPVEGNELNFPRPSSSPTLKQTEEIKITESVSLSLLSDYQTLLLTKCNSSDSNGSSSANCNTDYIQLNYMYYTSEYSGAYLFKPASNGTKTPILNVNGAHLYHGENFIIIEFYNSKVTSQILFRTSDIRDLAGFEVVTLVDGSIADNNSAEIVLSLKYLNLTVTKLSGEPNPFYVDTNGYYFAARVYGAKDDNTRAGTPSINIPRNFYPMTTMMLVNDTQKRMTIITDRAQGVTQIPSGEVEIMIHRITKSDDGMGVNEPLDEKYLDTSVRLNITTRHFVLLTDALDTNQQASIRSREYEQPIQLRNVFDIPDDLFNSTLKDISKESDSPQDIDSNFIKLSTLDSVDESLLIRLHNTHDSETQQMTFCDENSTVNSDFIKMLGSPTYLVGIKSVTAQHLTNHKTIANISCEAPIQLLPQELRTFKIAFIVNSPEPDESSTSIYWLLGVILLTVIVIGLYLYRRATIRKKLVNEEKLLHEPKGTKNVNISGESENWLSDKIEENSSL